MTRLALLRHGPTDWNVARRLQGRMDVPLGDHGRAMVMGWHLPPSMTTFVWMASPLSRCVETAAILRARLPESEPPRIDPRLIEMDYGAWEGETLAALRLAHGERMSRLEDRGLDFRAPGGESPRDVQDRLRPWLDEIAGGGRNIIAVTHKGVIRAIYALASGWDMREKPPQRLRADSLHLLEVAGGADIRIVRLNVALSPSPVAKSR